MTRVVLGLGLTLSVLLLLLSLAAVPVVAMSYGGGPYLGIPVVTSIVLALVASGFFRAARRP
ncbi:MAG: hypothetical protein F2735_00455 [Actinobacteria bacterium]|uniref:Unannotated protein n=1 Tax=freshwater metagenome TaxID=449393 RepID=A0A6J6WTB3_9ZZZZ|nr:hypothetical protein [Actinomycetota bacterium]